MRAFIIYPPFETFGAADTRSSNSVDLIADIVIQSLRRGGDCFQYSVVWADPDSKLGATFDEDVAVPHVFKLEAECCLRSWLRKSIDPNTNGGGDVRSIATCRTVTFGYDGQAMLLLRTDDEPPFSPDTTLACVEERPDLITDSDWFDGWVRPK